MMVQIVVDVLFELFSRGANVAILILKFVNAVILKIRFISVREDMGVPPTCRRQGALLGVFGVAVIGPC
jgi:hypothetical protein